MALIAMHELRSEVAFSRSLELPFIDSMQAFWWRENYAPEAPKLLYLSAAADSEALKAEVQERYSAEPYVFHQKFLLVENCYNLQGFRMLLALLGNGASVLDSPAYIPTLPTIPVTCIPLQSYVTEEWKQAMHYRVQGTSMKLHFFQ